MLFTNENIMIGTQLDFKISNSLKLYLDFKNVSYDINEDTVADQIRSYGLQLKYNIKI